MRIRAALKAVLVSTLVATAAGGCAQVTVLSDQGPPKTEWKFGVLAIDLEGSARNTVVQAKGLGIVSTPSGATLGYASAKVVRIGDECRVVVTGDDLDRIARDPELRRLFNETQKACAA